MNHPLASIITQFDDPRYAGLALALQNQFRSNSPYPHAVLDDFLSPDVAQTLAQSYPDPEDSTIRWKAHSNENVVRQSVEDVSALSLPMRLFADAVISRQFLLFIEALSGIDCLIADPYFIGGGAMVTARDQYLKVHADFNWHHKLQMHRRLNFQLYLTPDWQSDWGGELELWPKDVDQASSRRIVPRFNRAVIFEVTNDSNHGQPDPLRTPKGIYRRVFSSLYCTTGKTDAEWNEPHFTIYKPENSRHGMSLQKDYQSKAWKPHE